jgi:hypothetical protein
MKKSILLLFGLLFIGSYVRAQVIENFDKAGSLGIFMDENWGNTSSPNITDSIYQASDPTSKSPGVLSVAFDLKGYSQHNAFGLLAGNKGTIKTNGAQFLTYYIYIPANSLIPDSVHFGLWVQFTANWNVWHELVYCINGF